MLPSGWSRRTNDVYQNLISLTSVLSSNLASDLRFSDFHIDSPETPAGAEDCPIPCVGLWAARIIISDGGITLGKSRLLEFTGSRHQLSENVTWHRGTHTWRFGFDWEHGTVTTRSSRRRPPFTRAWGYSGRLLLTSSSAPMSSGGGFRTRSWVASTTTALSPEATRCRHGR